MRLKDDSVTSNMQLKDDFITNDTIDMKENTYQQNPYSSDGYSNKDNVNKDNVNEDYQMENFEDNIYVTPVDKAKEISSEARRKDNIISIIFLVILAVWGICLYITYNNGSVLMYSLFGLPFLAIGISMIYGLFEMGHKRADFGVNLMWTTVVVYVGACVTIIPLLIFFVPSFKNMFGERAFVRVALLCFIISGVVQLFAGFYKLIYNKRFCTVKAEAICVSREEHHSTKGRVITTENNSVHGVRRRERAYSGIFKYEYNGIEYESQDDMYSNQDIAAVGQKYTIHINPNKPEQFYRSTLRKDAILFAMGVMFLFIGTLAWVVY